MKKLFRTSQKPPPAESASPLANSATVLGLQPKLNLTIPPVPHPTPHCRIAVLATPDALLFRPVIPGVPIPQSYIRMTWGDSFETEELSSPTVDSFPWNEAAIVFGILGCLKLITSTLSSLSLSLSK